MHFMHVNLCFLGLTFLQPVLSVVTVYEYNNEMCMFRAALVGLILAVEHKDVYIVEYYLVKLKSRVFR